MQCDVINGKNFTIRNFNETHIVKLSTGNEYRMN